MTVVALIVGLSGYAAALRAISATLNRVINPKGDPPCTTTITATPLGQTDGTS